MLFKGLNMDYPFWGLFFVFCIACGLAIGMAVYSLSLEDAIQEYKSIIQEYKSIVQKCNCSISNNVFEANQTDK